MERNELKEILLACVLVRRLAATTFVEGKDDKGAEKIVNNMLGLAAHAEQTAIIRAGTFMANNIKKEVEQILNKEAIEARNLLTALLQKKEVDNAIN